MSIPGKGGHKDSLRLTLWLILWLIVSSKRLSKFC
jgi:hypothetical protein